MLCKIADLLVQVPESGGMQQRCQAYEFDSERTADITIVEAQYRPENWPGLSGNDVCYMESGAQFHLQLMRYNGIMLHASAVAVDGKAYLFSGPSGTGKSTHTRLWQQVFGERAQVFNDDKPALRRLDGKWYAYGTPWCGKDGINQNMRVPLAGICFLKQAKENSICRLTNKEAVYRVFSQTLHRFYREENLDLMLSHVDKLVREVPVFELHNLPVPEAARLSYETMCKTAQEVKE